MTEVQHADLAAPRARTVRREDGFIYKAMAGVVFALVALVVLGASLGPRAGDTFAILLLLALLVFDIGWDLAMKASRRGDMLASTATSTILAKALRRAASAGATIMVVSYVAQDASRFKYVLACLVAWCAADVLARRADR